MKHLRFICVGLVVASLFFVNDAARAELVGLTRVVPEGGGSGNDGTTLLDIGLDPFSASAIGPSLGNLRLSGLDYDWASGTLYASSGINGSNSGSLFTVDYDTGGASLVGSGTGFVGVPGLAIDSSGMLYGTAMIDANDFSDRLITIDPMTGFGSEVGTFDNNISAIDGIAFHPTSGILYGVGGVIDTDTARDKLLTIDTSTGEATNLGQITEAGSGGSTFLEAALVGLTFDPLGNLYASLGGDASNLGARGQIISIDILAMEYTLLGDVGDGTAFNGAVSDIAAIPEPSSFALLSVGAASLVGWRRRKSRSASPGASLAS